MAPRAELLDLPKEYGVPKRTLEWSVVRSRLEEAKAYWIATTRADGRPHVVPVDGLWVDDVFYYGGGPTSVHQRTVRHNPRVVMHLPDPQVAVIVEGEVRVVRHGPAEAEAIAAAGNAKYPEYGGADRASAYLEIPALVPAKVLAWSAYPTDATRFVFDDAQA